MVSRISPDTSRALVLRRTRGAASRRKIDGQRDAIEAPTDCSNCWKVLFMRREIRLQRPRRGDEEQHRAVTKYIAGFLMLGRYIQWGNAVLGPHIASMHKWKRVRGHGSERRSEGETPSRAPCIDWSKF
jgi:hypothetical protein